MHAYHEDLEFRIASLLHYVALDWMEAEWNSGASWGLNSLLRLIVSSQGGRGAGKSWRNLHRDLLGSRSLVHTQSWDGGSKSIRYTVYVYIRIVRIDPYSMKLHDYMWTGQPQHVWFILIQLFIISYRIMSSCHHMSFYSENHFYIHGLRCFLS